jgi:hypothetical protein
LGIVSPVAALLQQSGFVPDDPARRKGSWGMYALYARAAGRSTMAFFMLAMAVYAFSSSFPSECSPPSQVGRETHSQSVPADWSIIEAIWLGWWAEDSFQSDYKGNGYWLGIYVVLGVGSMIGAVSGIW